jgi:hypothetical protein
MCRAFELYVNPRNAAYTFKDEPDYLITFYLSYSDKAYCQQFLAGLKMHDPEKTENVRLMLLNPPKGTPLLKKVISEFLYITNRMNKNCSLYEQSAFNIS